MKHKLKDVCVSFDRDLTATLTGALSLHDDVRKLLIGTGVYIEEEEKLTNSFRFVIRFKTESGFSYTKSAKDFKEDWDEAIAADEHGLARDCFIDEYGCDEDGNELNLRLSAELLVSGRLEIAVTNHDNETCAYSERLTKIVDEMSIDTVKYFASVLNARLQKGE